MEDPNQIELVRKAMGEAILLQERLAFKLHNAQRMAALEKAPHHERVASIMRTMNQQLSVVDADRDLAIAAHTQDVLRNSRVKSELAGFLVLQSQLQRLSSLIEMGGAVDERLRDASIIEDMNVNQLLTAQRSYHTQLTEIMEYIRNVRTDSLEGLIKAISPEGNKEIRETVSTIAKLPPQQREKLSMFMRKLITEAGRKDATGVEVVQPEPPAP